jgi:hypothetical protein
VYERYVSGSYEGQKRQKAQSTKMKEMLAKRGHKDVQLNEYERAYNPAAATLGSHTSLQSR